MRNLIRQLRKLNDFSEREFLALFFTFFSCSFLVAALFMPDLQHMFEGLWIIVSSPSKGSTNCFSLGGYAATFLNMGLIGLVCTALYCIPGKKSDSAAMLVTILTTGFGSWGINIVNMWPTMLGVMLHAVVRREKIGDHTNQMLFSTGLAPFISELLVRYPNAEVGGFTVSGVLLALAVGLVVGFFLPAGLRNSPTVHKGFDLYSAALPVGMTAFLLQGLLYRAMGVAVPDAISDLHVANPALVNGFCIALFSSLVLIAFIMGCGPKQYWKLLTGPDRVLNFDDTYGNATMLMNVGMYGFFILAYYNLIGAEFNGVTFGVIFCMLATCNSGSHPGNVWAIMLGYALAEGAFRLLAPITGGVFIQQLNAQAVVVGLCYANGLSPIGDKYGWRYAVVASMMHFCMVTTVPELHGSMCLYNGGFTAALVCLLMVPGLEHHFKTKAERRALRAQTRNMRHR